MGVVLSGIVPALAQDGPIAVTSGGRVRGLTRGGIVSFRGIPYGGRAGADRRFKRAAPLEPWQGVRDCTKTGPRAMQQPGSLFLSPIGDYFSGGQRAELGLDDQVESEDCLVLNVLTPALDRKRRPVLFYIHGGGFNDGSGVIAVAAYRLPKEEDIVVVSVNHRLNVFGFLALGHLDPAHADSANAGMLDLVDALKWVRANIAAFGGDPANITIMGESGGGGKVSTLLAMPEAKGLFHRAIVQSGSMLQCATAQQAAERTDRLLKALGLGAGELDKLRQVPARELYDAARKAGFQAGPAIDGKNLLRQPFAPDAPPTAKGVSMIIGYDEDETRFLMGFDKTNFALDEASLPGKVAGGTGMSDANARALIASYRASYPKDTPSDLFFRITSDRFGNSSHIQAERKVAQGDQVYKYFFRYPAPVPVMGVPGETYRAFHTAEIPLIFRLVLYPEMEAVSRTIAHAWARFARTGSPSSPALPWSAYSLARRETMVFDKVSRQVSDPGRAQRLEWQRLQPDGRLF